MAPDYRKQVERALQRQRVAEENRKASLIDDRMAARMPASILSVKDVSDIIADALATQRHDILGHVNRLFQLTKMSDRDGDTRNKNLHMRLTAAESAIRRLEKGRSR